jgi:hypothetical protein
MGVQASAELVKAVKSLPHRSYGIIKMAFFCLSLTWAQQECANL